jgi:alkanesulfonate monooxygenase SsuD/methylene tetrahydromethanopterin reductase-like flavin-dependent oxidoreductase (luciferase family)
MHIGLGLQMANLDRRVSDADVYNLELGLAARAEGAGFDSVWVSEHHFSDYQLTSQQSMVLSWLAAQTTELKLGTFVTVLPWNDPARVAESFSVLDHMSGGRAILGLGRGLGQKEFVGFRVPMGESRKRFTEYSEALLEALESGVLEYDGELYQQPRVEIRPDPIKSFRGRTFASAVSPESMEIMARMGVGLLVIAQKPWETTEAELESYRARYLELNGHEAPKPVLVIVAGVAKDAAQVKKLREVNLQRWARSTVEHYEFDNVGFADIPGYEYYGALANNIAKHGVDKFNGFLADLQVWGTPEEVTEKLLSYVERTDAGGLVCPLVFGGMSADEAEESFELFSTEVLPELKRHDVGGDIGVTYDAAPAAVA